MTLPMDPMSYDAQIEMNRYAADIRRHAVFMIHENRQLRKELNNQTLEE